MTKPVKATIRKPQCTAINSILVIGVVAFLFRHPIRCLNCISVTASKSHWMSITWHLQPRILVALRPNVWYKMFLSNYYEDHMIPLLPIWSSDRCLKLDLVYYACSPVNLSNIIMSTLTILTMTKKQNKLSAKTAMFNLQDWFYTDMCLCLSNEVRWFLLFLKGDL